MPEFGAETKSSLLARFSPFCSCEGSIKRCLITVSCEVPSCESANFRWIPGWEPN